ncbi:14620_t:CDS:1, partial [Gigaspora rosea]
MDKLVKNSNIFKKKFYQIAETLIKRQQDVLKKDKRVALWLGL